MLSSKALKEIDRSISKYPANRKRSAVMAALAIAQTELGWLSPEIMQFVANYLEIPAIAVQEIASFYSMYNACPVGKYKIKLCTNLPCQLSGADVIANYLRDKLGVDFNQTTKDGFFTLQEGECMGACGDSPVLLLNNHSMYSFMNQKKIDQMIQELCKK